MKTKPILFFAIPLILSLCLLCGCVSLGGDSSEGSSEQGSSALVLGPQDGTDGKPAEPVEASARYIRVGSPSDGASYPLVAVISSKEALTAYSETNRESYRLEQGFLDACNDFNDGFFAEKALVLIGLAEGSGSTSHQLESVTASSDETLQVKLFSVDPEVGTCDMAYWHILVEIPKQAAPSSSDRVSVYYNSAPLEPIRIIDPLTVSSAQLPSFSLTWNTYGVSSYDSATGILVKTKDASHPERYRTVYFLSEEERQAVLKILEDLDLQSYPDVYDPHEGTLGSDPSMTLILSLRWEDGCKTVSAQEIAHTYTADNEKGQAFLSACKGIADLLTATEAWQSFPEYEFFYD